MHGSTTARRRSDTRSRSTANLHAFKPLRPLAEIDAELLVVTDHVLTMIGGADKMTFDLPEDLLREAKIQAIQEGKTFKDKMAEIFTLGLENLEAEEAPKAQPPPRPTRSTP